MALHSLRVKGFRSIRDQSLELSALNVFIGANGAGKSNLIGVFRFLNSIVRQELAIFARQAGGANAVLYYGRKVTEELSLEVVFRQAQHENIYEFTLRPTAQDSFLFAHEATWYRDMGLRSRPYSGERWSGHAEAQLPSSREAIAGHIQGHLNSYRVYHFHDTSAAAAPRQLGDIRDNRFLHHDARNLAAFLYRLQEKHPGHFQNINDAIRQVAPFFKGFKLAPDSLNPEKILLEWEERGSDAYFNASSLSDGTLRFICLATLLLQPELPPIVLIDEPELGLHPAAIVVLAGMLQSASARAQLLVATQSVTLVNQLEPEQVWVVDRCEGESAFRHLKHEDMSSWLEDYGLGDLWEKNVLGGKP